jgi:serine/threonine protein kinase
MNNNIDKNIEDVVNKFKESYNYKYEVKGRLGEGQIGVTYRATDKLRGSDVCLKFFKSDPLTSGVMRDWEITSKIKHELIVDTQTIEKLEIENQDHYVAVSRFINGKNLEVFLNELDKIKDIKKTEYFFEKIFNSLCDSVSICHEQNSGHGDLHERNIIIEPSTNNDSTYNFKTILIDFDNASFKNNSEEVSEENKKKGDLRALIRISGFFTYGISDWHNDIQEMLAVCIRHLSDFLGSLFIRPEKKMFNYNHFKNAIALKTFNVLAGNNYTHILGKFYEKIAREFDSFEIYELVKKDLKENPQKLAPHFRMTGSYEITPQIDSLIKNIFEDKDKLS